MAEHRRWSCDICHGEIEQAERQPVCLRLPGMEADRAILIDLCEGCADVEAASLVGKLSAMTTETPRLVVQAVMVGLGSGEPVWDVLKRAGKLVTVPEGGENGADQESGPETETVRAGGPPRDQQSQGSSGGAQSEGEAAAGAREAAEAVAVAEWPVCTRCKGLGEPDHGCPYAEEINDNHELQCNCCPGCQHECAMEI
jgi:hypothetical protein